MMVGWSVPVSTGGISAIAAINPLPREFLAAANVGAHTDIAIVDLKNGRCGLLVHVGQCC